MKYIIVLMTASNKKEAESITHQLLEEQLIACANILESVSSLFWWKEKIEQENESLVLMKSNEKLFKPLVQRIKQLHSYEVPEILALPIIDGFESYLNWMRTNLKR